MGMQGAPAPKPFSSIHLTTLGDNGPDGPKGVNGYIGPSCPDTATQLVQSRALALVPAMSGVQRFTVPVTGTYRLAVSGEYTMLRLFTHRHSERCANLPGQCGVHALDHA